MSKVLFKEIAEVKNGSTPSTKIDEYYDGEIIWITPKDLSNLSSKYVSKGERNISQKGYDSCSTTLIPKGSILLSSRAPIGLLAIANNELCTNQGFKNLILNDEKVFNEYLFYWLKTRVDYISSLGSGTTFKEVSRTVIENLEIDLPILNTQKQIAKVLSDLDAKIEVNNKINQDLEALAKSIYDYWFVQFDFPDQNGKPYKSSGGKMLYNEELKRDIPEGWEVGSLVDIATYTNGIACQKYRPDSDAFLPVIKIREMRDGITAKTEKVKVDIPEKVKVFDGDVLFSWSASLEVILWSGGDGGLNQHIFKVTSKKFPKSFYYFELINYLQHFKMVADLRKTTMGHITRDHLKQSKIIIPPLEIIKDLDEKLKPILDKQVLLNKQNQKLAALRDWLLPMLMNGQVTVRSPEEVREQDKEILNQVQDDNKQVQDDSLGRVAEDKEAYKINK